MMSRLGDVGAKLYRGEVSINFVGRQRLWYAISGLILLVSIVALLVRGLDLQRRLQGRGGLHLLRAVGVAQPGAGRRATAGGVSGAIVQQVKSGNTNNWQVQTKSLTDPQTVNSSRTCRPGSA